VENSGVVDLRRNDGNSDSGKAPYSGNNKRKDMKTSTKDDLEEIIELEEARSAEVFICIDIYVCIDRCIYHHHHHHYYHYY
jgi:hypothetical protein